MNCEMNNEKDNEKNIEKNKGIFLMLLCSVLWSISGILIKYISWNPLLIAGVRSLISAGVVGVFMVATHKKFVFNRTSALGAVALCCCVTCFVTANKMTTAANAIVLQYIAPIFVLAISAIFLKKKLKKADVLAVAVTFGGIVLFFLDEISLGGMIGNFVAIASGFFMAIMFVINGEADDNTRISGILMAHLLTFLIGMPIGSALTEAAPTGREILFIIILGIVQLGIPYVLYSIAASKISALSCSLIGMIEPLLNPVWVAVFYGEIPGMFAFMGAFVVLTALISWTLKKEATGDD